MSEVSITCDLCRTSGFQIEEIEVALYPHAKKGIYVCRDCAATLRGNKEEYVVLKSHKQIKEDVESYTKGW